MELMARSSCFDLVIKQFLSLGYSVANFAKILCGIVCYQNLYLVCKYPIIWNQRYKFCFE